MTTVHESKLQFLEDKASFAKLQAENASFKMGETRREQQATAKKNLADYIADESQHDHSEIIHLIRDDGYCDGCNDTPCSEIIEAHGVEFAGGVADEIPQVVEPPVMSSATDLVVATSQELVANFPNSEDINALVAATRARAQADAAKFDISTPKGRTSIISVAVSVRDVKVKLDKAAAASKRPMQDKINDVNTANKALNEALTGVQAEIRDPVTAWENTEKARVFALKERLFEINTDGFSQDIASDDISAHIDTMRAIELGDDWQEFREDAAIAKDRVLNELSAILASAVFAEAQEAELAELRAAKAYDEMRAEADRENAAFDDAVIVAEDKMRTDAEYENIRFEQAKIDKIKAVQKAQADAETKRVSDLKAAEEKRLADIETTKAEERAAAQKIADDKEASTKAANENLARLEKIAQDEIDRQTLEREKEHGARVFRSKVRKQLTDIVENMTTAEFVDAIMADEIPLIMVRFDRAEKS